MQGAPETQIQNYATSTGQKKPMRPMQGGPETQIQNSAWHDTDKKVVKQDRLSQSLSRRMWESHSDHGASDRGLTSLRNLGPRRQYMYDS